MKIILTGSSGFVGTKLSKFLSNKVNDVYGIDVVKKEKKSLKGFFDIDLSKINSIRYFSSLSLKDSINDDFRFDSNFWDPWKTYKPNYYE
mgnify:CR=1 FL=1